MGKQVIIVLLDGKLSRFNPSELKIVQVTSLNHWPRTRQSVECVADGRACGRSTVENCMLRAVPMPRSERSLAAPVRPQPAQQHPP